MKGKNETEARIQIIELELSLVQSFGKKAKDPFEKLAAAKREIELVEEVESLQSTEVAPEGEAA